MHGFSFRCNFCLSIQHAKGSSVFQGKRYCKRCLYFFQLSEKEDARPVPASLKGKPERPERRSKGTVKWWDAKAGEWRWVSKRSKPELKPYEY